MKTTGTTEKAAILLGLTVIAGMGSMTAKLNADPNCYKREGYGYLADYNTRSGCSGEGDVCFWVTCATGTNDDCFSYMGCRPPR